jgi:hypothetical protein
MKKHYYLEVNGKRIELKNRMQFGAYLEAMDHLLKRKITNGDLYYENHYICSLKITYPTKQK